MSKYEQFRDSLICEKNDRIDNAAHNVITVIIDGNGEDPADAVKQLVTALLPNNVELAASVDIQTVIDKAETVIKKLGIENTEWNMEYIAEVTAAVEGMLDNAGITVCHPFFIEDEDIDEDDENYDEDNDGILCCLSCDRCDGCPEKLPKS